MTIARDAALFGPMSINKTVQASEAIVDRYDPGALRRTRATARTRDVAVDSADQPTNSPAPQQCGAGCSRRMRACWIGG
jgi:hypothetical protein